MTRKILFSTIFTIAFACFSKGYSQTTFSSQLGGNCFTLAIPDYLSKTYQLNDVASLQYMNTDKAVFVIVVDDDKDQLEEYGATFNDAKHFLDFFTEDYMLDAKNRSISDVETFTIRTTNLAQAELKWTDEDTDFFMLITTQETKNHLYKILCWTVEENRAEYMDDFKKIASSLME